MLWYVKKVAESEDAMIYSYGKETKEQTGQIKAGLKSESFECLKLADGDTPRGAERLFPTYTD